MSFHDRRREASFRGVSFIVTKRDKSGGRRGPTHETPQRDAPDAEDTGARAPGFSVSAMIVGEDYDIARDRLVAALEKPGPGIYVDPWGMGEQRVIVRKFRVAEDDKKNGLAAFDIQFEIAGDPAFPRAAAQTPGVADQAANRFATASAGDFGRRFRLDGYPQFVADDAQVRLSDLTRVMGSGTRGFPPGLSTGFRDALAGGADGMTSALRGDLGAAVQSAMSSVANVGFGGIDVPGDPAQVQSMFAGLSRFGNGWPPVPTTTATRQVQASNAVALTGLVHRVAVAMEARSLSRMSFDSVDQAFALRDGLLGRLDAVSLTAARDRADDTVAASAALRAAVVADVLARSGGLPRRRTAAVNDALPAVVMAYRLYGDAAAAADLTARNPGFRHPMFSPRSVDYLG